MFRARAGAALCLRKKCFLGRSLIAAAKAVDENKPVIAAVNRCATQNQMNIEFFRKLYCADWEEW